jgi:hypothetical protein
VRRLDPALACGGLTPLSKKLNHGRSRSKSRPAKAASSRRTPKSELMGDWIGLAIIGFIILCGVFAVWQLSKPYDVTVEEFEKRAAEAPSLMSAGLVGLQKILDPATAKAVEAQEDFREGRFDAEQGKGDGPEPGEDGKQ